MPTLSLDLPTTLSAGTTTSIRLTIEVRGTTLPCHTYELPVRISNSYSAWEAMVGRTERSSVPGVPIIQRNQLDLPAEMKPGRHTVNPGLFDASRQVGFALNSRQREAEGYYRVTEVKIEPTKHPA